jgi:hypothetical protein
MHIRFVNIFFCIVVSFVKKSVILNFKSKASSAGYGKIGTNLFVKGVLVNCNVFATFYILNIKHV